MKTGIIKDKSYLLNLVRVLTAIVKTSQTEQAPDN